MTFAERIQNPDIYHYPNIDWDTISADLAETVSLSNGRKVKYFQCPISFDIEVTSFEYSQLDEDCSNTKYATMYAWGLSVNGHVILGREWHQLEQTIQKLADLFGTDKEKRILIYVHNLAYEFQFICKRFEWDKVFALKERKPLYALTDNGVEFRCSYMLSGYKLEKAGEDLQRYPVKKLVGALDYNLPRHSKTPLTEAEWQYLINDVQIVCAYIQETAENDGGYHKIPLTKTGYVRNYCRNETIKYNRRYKQFINYLTLDEDEYHQLKRAFAGGFTHANWRKANKTIRNMDSFDFTSSYPAVMIAEKFPMSKSEIVSPADWTEFRRYLQTYCCLFDVRIEGLDGWEAADHIISASKCTKLSKEHTLNNGRVIYAEYVELTITEVDFESIEKFYRWDNIQIANMRIYRKTYLPYLFVKAILSLYKDKTELKDVDGKEVEYMKSKGMINSAYGMTVTDIIRNEDTYLEEWTTKKGEPKSQIESYNKNKNRFLFYPWGVWVTAYARRNLYTAISEFGDDYVYSDTDSVKVENIENHMEYIESYNREITQKMEDACAYHHIPVQLTRPKTIEGIEKPLGVWDFDGHYDRFKTLGAKRYLVEQNGKHKLTVAGLNKGVAVPFMEEIAKEQNRDIFDVFEEDLTIPGNATGKLTHTYIDFEQYSVLTDYLGNTAECHELSCIHLEPAEYHLSIEETFMDLISGKEWTTE